MSDSMGLYLPPDVKGLLIDTARCFRAGDEHQALQHFHSVSEQNTPLATLIYGRLWQLMDKPSTIEVGKYAFWNESGYTATLRKKTQAIEDVLKLLIEKSLQNPPPAPVIPPDAKPVIMPAFVDCGFDPRFAFSGDYASPVEQKGIWTILVEWLAYIEFSVRAYLSFNSEERAVRQMLLSLAKAENVWAKYTDYTFTENFAGISSVSLLEREFLETATNYYKLSHPELSMQLRLYPQELLKPIHVINKPQSQNDWGKEASRPGWENGDLSRCGRYGFWRLNQSMYDVYSHSKKQIKLDPDDLSYVPHYIFIHAITNSSDQLKTAMRDYRSQLASVITDRRYSSDFSACKTKIDQCSSLFHRAWTGYVNSHELLTEAQEIFSTIDPYRTSHEFKKWRWEMSKLPFFSDWYTQHCADHYEASDYWEQHYDNAGNETLKQFVLNRFPPTANSRFLDVYQKALNS